jgi:D-3-phosphoglycerate dehydrogenase
LAKFRIATPTGASFTTAGDYGYEMEALIPIDAEIFEIRPGSEDEFVSAARGADALYAKGRRITKQMIDGLDRCKIIALGSVGVDSVDVEAATQKGIPVTNCPDTFIDEVADHAMTLILATFRRLIVQDKLVRDGRWSEGRPMLSTIPRLMGQTLGLVSFGHVARAVARRAKAFGLHVIAYDPFIEELVAIEHGVEPVSLPELLRRALPPDEKDGDLHQHRTRPDDRRSRPDQGARRGDDRRRRARRARTGAARRQQPAVADG